MKKALPYIYHILCSLVIILLFISLSKYVFKIELTPILIAISTGIIFLLTPKFNSIETQSGTKIQVKWFLFKKPKFI
ncbi:hypothetical protein [Mesonia maritima]|uniref:Membrane protein n=1 Tax=Mesonia maritima TaxID=1793873 RepID=A0ABU1K4Z7_9FLAO|nr:hypothetical protein [Mesonia maritima]MDR6300690.1 putative membrane protein [Mesonia maritima]